MEDEYVDFDQDIGIIQQGDESKTYVNGNAVIAGSDDAASRPRTKTRTKSYELALEESVDGGVRSSETSPGINPGDLEHDYLPMGGPLVKEVTESRTKAKPRLAPRPKDLNKRLHYALERVVPPASEAADIKPRIVPTRKAPTPPAKPPQEVVEKYFPPKGSSEVIEKVTVIKEERPSGGDKSKKWRISKVHDRPRSSTWYDLNDTSDAQGEWSSSDDENGQINYVEIADQDRLRPQSAFIESEIKLPTRKRSKGFLSGGILDTIRSWSGGGSSKKSPRNSIFSLENSSKFYSDPNFLRSSGSVSSSPRQSITPVPSPGTPVLKLDIPVPALRSSILSANDKSPQSPPPPVPPPRVPKNSRSFESEDPFDNALPDIPSSISSDSGLAILTKSSHLHKSGSKTHHEATSGTGKAMDSVDLCCHNTIDAPVPMLHPIDGEELKLKMRHEERLHPAIQESTQDPEEDVDSLDVFIPPIEQQRVLPARKTVLPTAVATPKRPSHRKKKVSSVDDLDVVVHGDRSSSGEEDYSGYIDPDQMVTDDLPPGNSPKISDDVTPPALPPRQNKSAFNFKPAVLPPTADELADKPHYRNTQDDFLSEEENRCAKLQRAPSEYHYSVIAETDAHVSDLSSQHAPVVPVPSPRSKPASFPNGSTESEGDDVSTNPDAEPPALPLTPPPNDPPNHWSESDLESSPERTPVTPPLVKRSVKSSRTKRPLPDIPDEKFSRDGLSGANNENCVLTENETVPSLPVEISANDSIDFHCVIASNENDSRTECTNPDVSTKSDYSNYDVPIPVGESALGDDWSSGSESSESDSDETSSSTSSEGRAGQYMVTKGSFSGETTPVVESKSFLGSLTGDRASVATLTPSASGANSLDYVETSSSSASHEDLYEKIEAPDYSSQDLMSEPVRLRRQVMIHRDSASLQSYTSSEDSSRPTSWASFNSADVPTYSPQTSTNGGELLRPTRGDLRVSSDISILSDVSRLSLADSTHSSIDSGQCSDDLSEEEKFEEKRKKKLFLVAQEIMTSEQTFVDVLKLLNENFRKVIAKSSEAIRAPVVPPAVLNQILNHLPELQIFSEGLLQDLKLRIANWENDPRIADIFVKKGPFLKLYTTYIMDYDNKCTIFDEARKKYYEFDKCTTIFEASTHCYKLTLRHYMLKPVQRIPQYRLLLQDYQKYLTEDSPDYEDTKVALKIVTEVAEHANQSMKYGENLNKLLEIQNKLLGGYEIIKPGRYLIKEGMLNKVSRKETQPRMFFLMNDVLLYTAPYTYNTYDLKNVLPLVGMKVRLADDAEEEYQKEFSIISTQRSFTVAAESEAEKNEWVSALKEAIGENNEKRRTFVPDSKLGDPVVSTKGEITEFKLGTRHPVWIPDDRVSMCMLCSAEFTLIFRRHHCRACGKVVCLFCSDYQAPLRYLHNKPSRVCKTCYSKLKKEVRTSTSSMVDVKEGDDSSVGLLSLFSKSASNIKKSAHKHFHRVSNLRDSFGMATGKKTKSKALTEVSATDKTTAMSGYLKHWKDKKWVKNWYIVKGNVLYMFKGSEDTAASGSTVLLGYEVRPFGYTFQGVEPTVIFELIHKGLPSLMFRTESEQSRDKWMKAMRGATVPL